jgi:protein O-mannosyl-transferase
VLRDSKRFEPTASAGNDKAGVWQAPALSKQWLFASALVAAVFLAYLPAWRGEFVFDDDLHLLNNPVLKPGGLAGAWTPGGYLNYWPLTFTVYRLEFEAWGLNVLGFHLVNIALHAVAALLVWRVLAELDMPGAMFAAAIFALHPVNVESVAWIAQLKGLLALLFALVSTLLYLQFDRTYVGTGFPACPGPDPDRPGGLSPRPWMLYAASIAAFLLSTLAKGMAITLPVVLLACAWWRRGSIGRRDLVRIIPFALIAAIMAGIEIQSQWRVQEDDVVRTDGLLSRSAVAACAVWFYLEKLVWPLNLCLVYPRWRIDKGDAIGYLPGLLLLAIVFALALRRRRTWGRPVVMLIVCYVGLLLPALGFVNISYMRYSLVADHWQYAAAVVPCAALAGAAAAWSFRRAGRRPAAWVLGLLLLAVLWGLTWRHSRAFASVEALWTDTLAKDPNCALAHEALAFSLIGHGRVDEVIDHYRKALAVAPNNFQAQRNLGNALIGRSQVDEAIDHYRKALQIKPDYFEAHNNLGLALAGQRKGEEAIGHYRKALQFKPDYFEAHNNLGLALAAQGKDEEAIRHYRKALEIKPDFAEANSNLGLVLADRGQVEEAIACFREAVKFKPDSAQNHYNLAVLISGGRVDEAIDHYRKAVEIKPDYLEAHYNLGDALAGRGKLDEALPHYQKALNLASVRNDGDLVDAIRVKIRLAGNPR